jgi:acetyl esterase/lipase
VRRALAAIGAIAFGAAIAFATYGLSVQPGAAIVKAVFETGAEVTPPSGFAGVASTVTETKGVPIRATGAPDASIDVYAPQSASALPVVLWIHGGGFISSSADTVRDYAILLANAGYVVASLDYSLAPGARYPTPIVQGNAALAYLAANADDFGGDPSNISLGGDSAGAQIAAQLAAVQSSPALATTMAITPALEPGGLRSVLLFCGLYDMDTVGSTGFPALRTYLWSYTGTRTWTTNARIDELSVTRHLTADYPATFITVGDADPFAPQAAELTDALTSAGVPVTGLFYAGSGDGLGHEYQFDFTLPQAQEAFTKTSAFLAEKTGASQ